MDENNLKMITDIEKCLKLYMEERFLHTCVKIQKVYDMEKEGIKAHISESFRDVRDKAIALQNQGKKGRLAYWIISKQRTSLLEGRICLRIESLDNKFWLDEEEAAAEYYPLFLEDSWNSDLEYFSIKLKEKYIRIQKYQLDVVKNVYASYYYSILFKLLCAVIKDILCDIGLRGEWMENKHKVIFGEYMGEGIVIFNQGG